MTQARIPLAVTAAANLLLNVLFPVLALRALGVGNESDTLFLVFVLPSAVLVLLAGSVLSWLTPCLVRRAGNASRRLLAWSVLWVLLAGGQVGVAVA